MGTVEEGAIGWWMITAGFHEPELAGAGLGDPIMRASAKPPAGAVTPRA